MTGPEFEEYSRKVFTRGSRCMVILFAVFLLWVVFGPQP